MRLEFTKMHGCGNDYIYLDCLKGMIDNAPELARRLSPRRFSVGSDGLICIAPSQVADATMRMFNADGSESAMCGNGIRCVAQWLYEHKVAGDEMTIETLACGTGACASAAAAVMLRLCEPDTDIALDLPGGRLTIRVSEDWQIRMTGPAKTVYTGVVEV